MFLKEVIESISIVIIGHSCAYAKGGGCVSLKLAHPPLALNKRLKVRMLVDFFKICKCMCRFYLNFGKN